ncbi:hypothetical protein DPMN_024915 [Dreissena polymorpha]|uniref:Uncharacterized protein n=1 Tax=Dreissena polymorpha TaxID=45954 RepID=A0A9D4RCT7_DREPO|nr:hypothetical protein DPMN_024915 [Dreissena polymorpha]
MRRACSWVVFVFGLLVVSVISRRYTYCSEGCCPEEYCAFKLICYPKIRCTYGCPDGECLQELCMPMRPCTRDSECSIAQVCTRNYNLGYDTCQYNLEIGKSVCVDTKGRSLRIPIS